MRDFVVDEHDPFLTPAEASDFTETATYDEVSDFFAKLAQECKYVDLQSLTTLPTGQELLMVTVSGERAFDPEDMKAPIVFVTAGIHPGESSGVNAGMMFIRNLVMDPTYESLLHGMNFLFIPVLNIPGYLRQSENGRINQYGPNTSGRRANAEWNNLNRDFSKIETPEIQAVVKVMRDYDVSFYIDMHSTDGMNYQPDVTWCDNGDAGLSNAIFAWMRGELQTDLEDFLTTYNHIPGPCYSANDPLDPTAGYYPYLSDGPTYSANYADHIQIPAYLLEIHSLKPNQQRVLGAYAFLKGVTDVVATKADSLRHAIATDRAARVDPVPITWDYDDPLPVVDWPIFEYTVTSDNALGIPQIIWTDIQLTIQVEEWRRSTPFMPPQRPYAYYIPAQWTAVIDKLSLHAIEMEVLTEANTIEVTNYRIEDFLVGRPNFEGRATASGTPVPEVCTRTYGPNDVVVYTDQPRGTLAVALLEPLGEGSFFYWGFFNSKFVSQEYAENYIVVPIAELLLEENDEIAAAWDDYKAENPDYANDPDAVLDWFYRKTAFYDTEAFVYPIGILYEKPPEPAPTSKGRGKGGAMRMMRMGMAKSKSMRY